MITDHVKCYVLTKWKNRVCFGWSGDTEMYINFEGEKCGKQVTKIQTSFTSYSNLQEVSNPPLKNIGGSINQKPNIKENN